MRAMERAVSTALAAATAFWCAWHPTVAAGGPPSRAALWREGRGPPDRIGRQVELPETQVRQAEVRPRCRLEGRELGRARELPHRVFGKTDLEVRQSSAERP